MDIKQSTVFNFSHTVGADTYNFTTQAESKEAACNKLINGLLAVIEELRMVLKAGTKPN